ncbi:glycosyltransferase [Streptomyces marincola]|uniref:glycosyltransferase n=1 Tax=Streptomyces marincola TaxID=2878388 RepID=UPI001CF2FA52|nr:glycosyltransferase [Streptomyces marincola]UCM89376.1 glycosyltransferase [Streptomyces marincola]
MRYLFTAMPGASHLYPMVPALRAARLAGHDVLVATAGDAVGAAARAGLPVLDVAEGQEIAPVFDRMLGDILEPGLSDGALMNVVATAFATIGDRMIDGLLAAARAWRPDAVVYEPGMSGGLITARETGVAGVVHGVGLRHPTAWGMFGMAPSARRLGIENLPEHPEFEICVSPDSLEALNETPGEDEAFVIKLLMNPTPFNGGGELPEWALSRGDRPRVVVSMGSASAAMREGRVLTELVRGAAALDAEVVVTTGSGGLPAALDPLPKNVRAVSWLPMSELLPVSDAVIHHAGMGTLYAAYAAGVPQLSVPPSGGQPAPHEVTEARGAGLTLTPDELTAREVTGAVRALLEQPGFRTASREVAAEMAAMPGPTAVMDRLTRLIRATADDGEE